MSEIINKLLILILGVLILTPVTLPSQEQVFDQQANNRLKELSKSASKAVEDGFYSDVVDWFKESNELRNPEKVDQTVWVNSMIIFSHALFKSGDDAETLNTLLKIKSSGYKIPFEFYECLIAVQTRRESLPEAIAAFEELFNKRFDEGFGFQFEDVKSYLSLLLANGDFASIEKWFSSEQQKKFLTDLYTQNPGQFLELNLIQAEAMNLSAQYEKLTNLANQISNFRLTPFQLWSIRYLQFTAAMETQENKKGLKWNEKIEAIQQLAKATGNSEAIWKTALAQSKAWLILKEYKKARECLIPLIKVTVAPDIRGEALLNIAQTFLSENKFEQALTWLEQYSGSQSDTQYEGWVIFTKAQIYFRKYLVLKDSGDSLEALNTLKIAQSTSESVINLIPKSDLGGYARFQLGWCLLVSGKLIPAREEFEAAFSLFPPGKNQLEALVKVGEIHLSLNLYDEAIGSFTSAEQLFVKYGYNDRQLLGRLKLANVKCFIGDKRLGRARDIVIDMIKNSPDHESSIEALLNYSQALVELEDPDQAINLLNEALGFSSSNLMSGLLQENIIYALSNKMEWELAVTKAEDWISRFSQHRHLPDVMYQLCYLTLQTQGREEAMHRFNQFISKFPDHPKSLEIHFWIAQYFYDEADYENALRNFDVIIKATHNTDMRLIEESKIKKSICYSRLGNHTQATSILTKMISEIEGDLKSNKEAIQSDAVIRAYLSLAEVHLNNPELGENAFMTSYGVLSDLLNIYGDGENIAEVRAFAARLLIRNVDTNQPDKSKFRLSKAESHFNKILTSGDASNSLKAEARYGLAIIEERRAIMADGSERRNLQKKASSHYRKIFYASPGSVNVYWIKKAGISAYKIATLLGSESEMESINKRFKLLFGISI